MRSAASQWVATLSDVHQFTTLPAAGVGDAVKIAVMGDLGQSTFSDTTMTSLAASDMPSLLVVAGGAL